ncbi:hypothetical protein [Streptomyces sp. S.PB5]|nr:hypothetical protein [Streptomyces sp. S.PB5]MDN3027917.1 hypothetical protein [Streptomyces sp. S.PB5]
MGISDTARRAPDGERRARRRTADRSPGIGRYRRRIAAALVLVTTCQWR